MKCRRLAVLAVGSALSGPIPGAEAGPAVFVDLDFDAAKAEAELQDKLLLVDTTATWCPPCRQMDKEAWVDADVEAWIPTHAVLLGGWDDAVARMALVEAALNVNQPRHDPHWAWIDKARELGGDVAELQNRLILTLSEGSEHQ